jgi:uncharacterized protein (TIGR00251 family)
MIAVLRRLGSRCDRQTAFSLPAGDVDNRQTLLTESTDAVLVPVRVKPRASHTRVAGQRHDRVLIEVTAPPIESKANDAVCRLLAKLLGIAPGRVTIAAGGRGRDKLVRIAELSAREVVDTLGLGEPQR